MGLSAASKTALAAATLTTLATVHPILDLLSRQPEFFEARQLGVGEVWVLVGAIGLGLPLSIALAVRLLAMLGAVGQLLSAFMLVGLFAVSFALFTRNWDVSGWLVVGIATLAGLASGLAYRKWGVARQFMLYLSPAIVIVPGLFLVNPAVKSLLWASDGSAQTIELTRPNSVVAVVLDELSLATLMTLDRRINAEWFPNFAWLADRSTWFRNATATTDVTVRAIPVITTGLIDPVQTNIPLARLYPNNLFTLLAPTHSMNVVEQVTRMCPESVCGARRRTLGDWLGLAQDLSIVYAHLIVPASWRGALPDVSTNWGNFAGASTKLEDAEVNLSGSTLREIFPGGWAKFAGKQLEDSDREQLFNDFVEQAATGPEPQLNFLHLLLPHIPYEFLADGTRYFPVKLPGFEAPGWHDEWAAVEALQRYVLQLRYVDELLGQLRDRLTAEGRLDSTLILITADHGVSFNATAPRRRLTENNAGEILPVPLFVKAPGQSRGAIIDRPVTSTDILPTVLEILGARDTPAMDGLSALAPAPGASPRLAYYEGGSMTLPSELIVDQELLERQFRILGKPGRDAEFFGIASDRYKPGQTISPATEQPTSPLTHVDQLAPPARRPVRRLTGHVEAPPTDPRHTLVFAVDSIVVATAKTLLLNQSQRQPFGTMLRRAIDPEQLLRLRVYAEQSTGELLELSVLGAGPKLSLQLRNGVRVVVRGDDVWALADGSGGWLDGAAVYPEKIVARGWAYSRSSQQTADLVVVFRNGEPVGIAKPNVARPDLPSAVGPGSEFAGFHIHFGPPEESGTADDLLAIALFPDGSAAQLKPGARFRAALETPDRG